MGVLVVNTAGLILIHRRATMLTSLGFLGQVLLAVMLAASEKALAALRLLPEAHYVAVLTALVL